MSSLLVCLFYTRYIWGPYFWHTHHENSAYPTNLSVKNRLNDHEVSLLLRYYCRELRGQSESLKQPKMIVFMNFLGLNNLKLNQMSDGIETNVKSGPDQTKMS